MGTFISSFVQIQWLAKGILLHCHSITSPTVASTPTSIRPYQDYGTSWDVTSIVWMNCVRFS
jgi:hypothetical protein